MRGSTLALISLGITAFGGSAANAAQTFTLNNVQFTDGSEITGTFTTDDAFKNVTSFSVVTKSSLKIDIDFGRTFSSARGDLAQLDSSRLYLSDAGFDYSLSLAFSSPLSASGVTIEGGRQNATLLFSRDVASGGTVSLTPVASAVPEPSTWAMMIVGFGVLGCAMRRTRKSEVDTIVSGQERRTASPPTY